MNKEKKFVKVNYTEYEGKFDQRIIKKMATEPNQIDVDAMRDCLYGYTFTENYAKRKVPDELFMDYWKEHYEKSHMDTDDVNCDDIQMGNIEEQEEMDMYIVDTPQEKLLLQTIDSTGDGQSPETALCVIDVGQEYEYVDRVFPYLFLKIERQRERNGIDCLQFQPNAFNIKCIYFDIKRRFDVGYFGSPTKFTRKPYLCNKFITTCLTH